jgi:uncharacterized membrane protein
MLFFAFLLIVVVGFLFLDLARTTFTRIGFSWEHALIVLLASLVGSVINIPIAKLNSTEPITQDKYIRVFGVTYRIPVVGEMTRVHVHRPPGVTLNETPEEFHISIGLR